MRGRRAGDSEQGRGGERLVGGSFRSRILFARFVFSFFFWRICVPEKEQDTLLAYDSARFGSVDVHDGF